MLISNQEFYLQPNSGANKCEGRVITFLDTFNVLDVKKKKKKKNLFLMHFLKKLLEIVLH